MAEVAPDRNPRPSLLRPMALQKGDSEFLPPAPPIEERPLNASSRNLEVKLEVLEQEARVAESEALLEMRIGRDDDQPINAASARPSLLRPVPLKKGDSEFVPPPPPIEERPADASSRNLITKLEVLDAEEAELLEEIKNEKTSKRASSYGCDVIFPLPRQTFDAVQEGADIDSSLNLLGLDMHRLASIMEQRLFSNSSLTRAMAWLPEPGDIVVSASPRCGQSLVVLMVRLLCAQNEEGFKEILAVPDRSAPWVECRLVDAEPEVLQRRQPGSNRIFRTCMSHSMLGSKVSALPETKFIVVFRNPVDLRMAWFEQLRSFFVKYQTKLAPGSSEDEWNAKFLHMYNPDDTAKIPITIVGNMNLRGNDQSCEYELNLRDWIKAHHVDHKSPNVLFLFLEEILAMPENTLRKIATFIGRDNVDADTLNRILDEVTGSRVLEISRRNSTVLTSEQEALLQFKFRDADTQDENPQKPRRGPHGLLQRMASTSESSAVSSRGIFTEFGHQAMMHPVNAGRNNLQVALQQSKGEQMEDLRQAVQLGREQVRCFSPATVQDIHKAFSDSIGKWIIGTVGSYEDLYEYIVGSKYPRMESPGDELSKEERPPRLTLMGGARKTLVNTFFQRKKNAS